MISCNDVLQRCYVTAYFVFVQSAVMTAAADFHCRSSFVVCLILACSLYLCVNTFVDTFVFISFKTIYF